MRRRPIIGLAGGIGSGKSFVASLFEELGCLVIRSDELVRRAYGEPEIRSRLREWWGEGVFKPGGEVDHAAVAARIFSDPHQKERLEQLLHPKVDEYRREIMLQAGPSVAGFVWDSPLLFETGLNKSCNAVVFVDAPLEQRAERVSRSRGWSREELLRRENMQLPLDRKREMSDYSVSNTADAAEARRQVSDVLTRICDQVRRGPLAGQASPKPETPE